MLLCWKVEPTERPSFKHLKMELESFALMLDQTRTRRASQASRISCQYTQMNTVNTQASYLSMASAQPINAQSCLLYSALMDANENLDIL